MDKKSHVKTVLISFFIHCKQASKKSNPLFEAPVQGQRMILLPHLGIGFGNLTATAENTPPGFESKLPEVPEIFKAATNCFETLCSYCCCMCCIQCCTRINSQCATALAQLCIGLGCFGCITCCSDICCSGNEGWNINFVVWLLYFTAYRNHCM